MEIQQGDHERNHASPKLVEPVRRWLDGGNLAVLVKKLRTKSWLLCRVIEVPLKIKKLPRIPRK